MTTCKLCIDLRKCNLGENVAIDEVLTVVLQAYNFVRDLLFVIGCLRVRLLCVDHRHSGRIKIVILAENVARQKQTKTEKRRCVYSVLPISKSKKTKNHANVRLKETDISSIAQRTKRCCQI